MRCQPNSTTFRGLPMELVILASYSMYGTTTTTISFTKGTLFLRFYLLDTLINTNFVHIFIYNITDRLGFVSK